MFNVDHIFFVRGATPIQQEVAPDSDLPIRILFNTIFIILAFNLFLSIFEFFGTSVFVPTSQVRGATHSRHSTKTHVTN